MRDIHLCGLIYETTRGHLTRQETASTANSAHKALKCSDSYLTNDGFPNQLPYQQTGPTDFYVAREKEKRESRYRREVGVGGGRAFFFSSSEKQGYINIPSSRLGSSEQLKFRVFAALYQPVDCEIRRRLSRQ